MKNAIIYARYSSDRQNEMSIKGQIVECKKYAEENDMLIIREYIDRALTATSDKRPNFLRMIEDSKEKNFEVVLVYQFDRFARNKNDSGYYKKILLDNGVKVVSAKEQIPNDSSGVITEGLLEVFADYFSKQLSEKVTRGMYQRAEKCKYNGGTMTFGYTVDKEGYYIPDEIQAPIIKEIFERVSQGETVKSICDDLNQRGVRTIRGNPFSKNSLQHILRNEKYKGVYIFGDMRVPDGIPRLVSDKLFEDVQNQLKDRHGHRPATEDYLLTGKLYCGHCKRRMVGSSGTSCNGSTYRYYICSNAPKKCNKKNVTKEFLEKAVLKKCREALTDDIIEAIVNTVVEINSHDQESAEFIRLREAIKATEQKIEKLLTEIEHGLTSSRIIDRLNLREAELEDLNKQLKKEQVKQIKIDPFQVQNFLRLLRRGSNNTIEYQKMLVHVFIDKIYLYDDHFIIYFKHINKTSSVSQNDVKKVEEYFSYSCSNTEECSVPINRGSILTLYFHIDKKMVPQKWLFLMVRCPGNHEFPDHEKKRSRFGFFTAYELCVPS